MPSTNPMTVEHLAKLLHVMLDLAVDHHHPRLAHKQPAERLQAHVSSMGGKEPLSTELDALRSDVVSLKEARQRERDAVRAGKETMPEERER